MLPLAFPVVQDTRQRQEAHPVILVQLGQLLLLQAQRLALTGIIIFRTLHD